MPRGPKSCLHDNTSSAVLRDLDKTLLCPSAAQCEGKPSPTETCVGVTKLFHGASTAEEGLGMTGNLRDGNLWSVTIAHSNNVLLNTKASRWATPTACGLVW